MTLLLIHMENQLPRVSRARRPFVMKTQSHLLPSSPASHMASRPSGHTWSNHMAPSARKPCSPAPSPISSRPPDLAQMPPVPRVTAATAPLAIGFSHKACCYLPKGSVSGGGGSSVTQSPPHPLYLPQSPGAVPSPPQRGIQCSG